MSVVIPRSKTPWLSLSSDRSGNQEVGFLGFVGVINKKWLRRWLLTVITVVFYFYTEGTLPPVPPH